MKQDHQGLISIKLNRFPLMRERDAAVLFSLITSVFQWDLILLAASHKIVTDYPSPHSAVTISSLHQHPNQSKLNSPEEGYHLEINQLFKICSNATTVFCVQNLHWDPLGVCFCQQFSYCKWQWLSLLASVIVFFLSYQVLASLILPFTYFALFPTVSVTSLWMSLSFKST